MIRAQFRFSFPTTNATVVTAAPDFRSDAHFTPNLWEWGGYGSWRIASLIKMDSVIEGEGV